MTAPESPSNSPTRKLGIWTSTALVLFALSFWFLASFTQALLPTKGSFGELKHPLKILLYAQTHPARAAVIPLFAILGLVCAIQAMRLARKGQLLEFFNSRLGASISLLSVGLCQLPLYFTGGLMDGNDPLSHINALVEATANYRLGQWPFYTFHYSNGTTLGLQYPMLRTLWGGLFNLGNPFGANFSYEFLCATTHLFMLVGFYRFLRVWRFFRFACVISACVIVGCHEMLLYHLSGAFPTFIASAITVWFFRGLARGISSVSLRHGLAAGYWLGLAVLAHPVTALFSAYFAIPLAIYAFIASPATDRRKFFLPSLAGLSLCAAIALPYLVSVVTLSPFNTYRPGSVSAFQDGPVRLINNFRWIVKYISSPSSSCGNEAGEYISAILCVAILAGWLGRLWERLSRKISLPFPPHYAMFTLWLACAGALLFYGRDTSLVSSIPGVVLLKVNNRSFIFFAIGIALLAVHPLQRLLRSQFAPCAFLLALLLFIEQAPYWLRPAYFSLTDADRFNASEFADYNRDTSCFLVILPDSAGGCGNREDVHFRRGGFSGISPIEHEEQPMPGFESEMFHVRLRQFISLAEAQALIERLKWLRVTDIVWRKDTLPGIDLAQLGSVRTITHGVALHLDGPAMKRGIREATLTVVPADLQVPGKTILPVGFSPFLHAYVLDRPGGEIPLSEQGGYSKIDHPMPIGARLRLESVTPWWQSAVTWVSVISTLIAGLMFLPCRQRRRS